MSENLVAELRAIGRQKTMMFTKATETSPTIADVADTAANTIDRLTRERDEERGLYSLAIAQHNHLTSALAAANERAERWKAEAMAWRAWWPLNVKSDTTERRTATEANEADIFATDAWDVLEAARALNDTPEPPATGATA